MRMDEATRDKWRRLLSRDAFAVLVEERTERAGSSPLNHEKRAGTYVCAACYLPLFDASAKYERHGMAGFSQALPDSLGFKLDFWLLFPRREYHCSRCSGHQGHVFNDGPKPTGSATATTASRCSSCRRVRRYLRHGERSAFGSVRSVAAGEHVSVGRRRLAELLAEHTDEVADVPVPDRRGDLLDGNR